METLERNDLEDLLSDDVGCQSAHRVVKECSVLVTHLFKSCIGSSMFCNNSADYVKWLLENVEGNCPECLKSAKSCWSVIPV